MKKQNILMTFAVVATLMLTGLACKLGLFDANNYKNTADKFSVSFPQEGNGVEEKSDDAKFAKSSRQFSKTLDNNSENLRIYMVSVYDMDKSKVEGKSERETLEVALNGWEKEPGTEIKEITVNGKKGIDCLRTIEIGKFGLTYREVIFWSKDDGKLYKLTISAKKKEIVKAKEADDFVNSFKFGA